LIGAGWICRKQWALLEWLILAKVLPTPAHSGNPSYVTGVFILTFCVIAFYLCIAALGDNLTIAAVLSSRASPTVVMMSA